MRHNSGITSFFILLAILVWQPEKSIAADSVARWQDHAAIRDTAQSFLTAFADSQKQGRSEVRLGQLDRRLKLKACKNPLEAFRPPGARVMGNTTVGIRCPDDGG